MSSPSYRLITGYRFLIFAVPVISVGVFVALIFTAAVNGDVGLFVFAAAWLLVMTWNSYVLLIRTAYELTISGEMLTWRSPLRSGSAPLADLSGVEKIPLGGQVQRITRSSGRSIWVAVRKGFVPFVDELHHRAPQISVHIGFSNRLRESFPGSNRYMP